MNTRKTVAGITTIKLPHIRLKKKFDKDGVMDYCPFLSQKLIYFNFKLPKIKGYLQLAFDTFVAFACQSPSY